MKDSKFKNGLEDRRERERDYYFSGFSTPEVAPVIPVPVPVTKTPKVIFTEQPDAIRNYRQPVTPSDTRRDAYKAMQDKVNFNRFMDSISIQNTLPPAYEPQSNLHSEGGQMETVKLWEELSIPEKAAMMRVAVKNGITNLQDIKREYNEFAKGGPKKKPSVNGNAQRAMDYFRNKGLSQHQAAGLVGNLMRESGMSPTAVNSSSEAYGLAQWLGPRKKALFNKYGNNPTLNQQLDFVWNELNSTHKKGLKALKSSKSAEEAARNAMGYYEFMAGPDAAVREMRKYGQDGEGSMRKGINYASILMGHSPSKSSIVPTTPIAPINPSISQESLESPIPFTPFNPEAFFATPDAYQQPTVAEEPEVQDPVTIYPYNPEEIDRQERMNKLSTFSKILSLTNPYPQEKDSFLSTIGLLTGNTYSKGGKIHIKPSHRGRLTELKKRTGKSEAELYKTGGPAVRKMITFARNARKWKHGLGGYLFDGTTEDTQQMYIAKPDATYTAKQPAIFPIKPDLSTDAVLARTNKVYSNYSQAKDAPLTKFQETQRNVRRYFKDNILGIVPAGISNCTLTATQWIDPTNPVKNAASITHNPEKYNYSPIKEEEVLPGNLLITKHPKKESYHTMLVSGFTEEDGIYNLNGKKYKYKKGEPLLTYSRGGHDTSFITKDIPLSVYIKNSDGKTQQHFYKYNKNKTLLPEVVVTNK